ncbi:MAG: SUMF1/EgtB/PvdO family nonheme iron enzyme [Candidatus Rokubacteria bacterium]|nr:SUMF1/EgtB/PvdO family nonheme iron enzyme [Candidatus Rokubacteria bacterium]
MILALLLASGLVTTAGCAEPERMVPVRAGAFWMGSDAAERRLAYALSSPAVREAGWFEAELARGHVTLPAFCIDRLLVTQAEYAAFVARTGHRPPGIGRDEYLRQGFLVHDYDREVTRYLWRDGQPPEGLADHPVVLASAFDAEAYCRWRHPALRLPSEAEWEKAARGDAGRIFPWGDRWDPERLDSAARGPGGTTPVTRYPRGASPYGVLDAAGNVFQWTASSLANGRRILKGCAWDDDAGLCRPAFRHGRPAESRHILIGFRCAGPTGGP